MRRFGEDWIGEAKTLALQELRREMEGRREGEGAGEVCLLPSIHFPCTVSYLALRATGYIFTLHTLISDQNQ